MQRLALLELVVERAVEHIVFCPQLVDFSLLVPRGCDHLILLLLELGPFLFVLVPLLIQCLLHALQIGGLHFLLRLQLFDPHKQVLDLLILALRLLSVLELLKLLLLLQAKDVLLVHAALLQLRPQRVGFLQLPPPSLPLRLLVVQQLQQDHLELLLLYLCLVGLLSLVVVAEAVDELALHVLEEVLDLTQNDVHLFLVNAGLALEAVVLGEQAAVLKLLVA